MQMNHQIADHPNWTVFVLQYKIKSTHLSVILSGFSIYLLLHLALYNKHSLKYSTGASFIVHSFNQQVSKSQQCSHKGRGITTSLFFFQHNFDMYDHLQ
jgi:hypothetical protein